MELKRRKARGLIPECNFIRVNEMQPQEVEPIIQTFLKRDKKKLTEEQLELLIKSAHKRPNPLHLQLLYPFF